MVSRSIRLFIAAVMLVAGLVAVPAVASAVEPADNWFPGAEQLSPGVLKSSSISAEGDVDWYYFYVYKLSDVTLTFDHDSWFSSMVLRKYHAAGFDRLNSINGTYTLQLEPGLYYLEVNDEPMNYSLKVAGIGVTTNWAALGTVAPWYKARTAIGVPEQTESNTDNQLARTKAYGPLTGFMNYKGFIQADGDKDWYRFFVTSPDDVTIGISYGPGYWGSSAELYYGTGLQYVSGIGNGGYKTLRLDRGTYYLKVEGDGYNTTDPYFFSVQGARVVANPYATLAIPTASTITPLAGQAFTVQGTISPKHAVGSNAITLVAEQYSNGAWRVRKTVLAPIVATTSTISTYKKTISLPYRGNWRIRAQHCDLGHYKSLSGNRPVTVK